MSAHQGPAREVRPEGFQPESQALAELNRANSVFRLSPGGLMRLVRLTGAALTDAVQPA